MYLVVGVLCLALAWFLWCLALLGSRNPKQPKWANDFMVGSIYVPGMMGAVMMAVLALAQSLMSLENVPIGVTSIGVSVAVVIASIFLYRFLHVPEKVKQYALQTAAQKTVPFPVGERQDDDHDDRPERPKGTKKAA